MPFLETSAKGAVNVEKAFVSMARQIMARTAQGSGLGAGGAFAGKRGSATLVRGGLQPRRLPYKGGTKCGGCSA